MKLLIGMTQDGWLFSKSITSLLNWISWGLPTGLLERRSQGSREWGGKKNMHKTESMTSSAERKVANLALLHVGSIMTKQTRTNSHFTSQLLYSGII